VLPLHTREIHFVNAPEEFHVLYQTIYEAFSKDVRDNMFMYGKDLTEFYKRVDRNYLPIEIGGNLKPEDRPNIVKEVLQWEPEWKKYTHYGYEE